MKIFHSRTRLFSELVLSLISPGGIHFKVGKRIMCNLFFSDLQIMEKCSSVIYSAFHQDYASGGNILSNIKSGHHLYLELRLIPKKYVFHGHEGKTLMMLPRSKRTRWCSCSEMLC